MATTELDKKGWTVLICNEAEWDNVISIKDAGKEEQRLIKWLQINVGEKLTIVADVESDDIDRTGADWYIDFVLHDTNIVDEYGLSMDYHTYVGFRDPEKAMLFKLTWL